MSKEEDRKVLKFSIHSATSRNSFLYKYSVRPGLLPGNDLTSCFLSYLFHCPRHTSHYLTSCFPKSVSILDWPDLIIIISASVFSWTWAMNLSLSCRELLSCLTTLSASPLTESPVNWYLMWYSRSHTASWCCSCSTLLSTLSRISYSCTVTSKRILMNLSV